jgi:hypothetical protein
VANEERNNMIATKGCYILYTFWLNKDALAKKLVAFLSAAYRLQMRYIDGVFLIVLGILLMMISIVFEIARRRSHICPRNLRIYEISQFFAN